VRCSLLDTINVSAVSPVSYNEQYGVSLNTVDLTSLLASVVATNPLCPIQLITMSSIKEVDSSPFANSNNEIQFDGVNTLTIDTTNALKQKNVYLTASALGGFTVEFLVATITLTCEPTETVDFSAVTPLSFIQPHGSLVTTLDVSAVLEAIVPNNPYCLVEG
jgi:hypothetical protein